MNRYTLPRLSVPMRALLRIPCVWAARGVQTDQVDEKGEMKERQTIDQSGPHPVGPVRTREGLSLAWQPGEDPSINGNVDKSLLPSFEYFQLKFLAKQSAILETAGIPISQSAKDASAYYEQAARRSVEMGAQLQWVLAEGMQLDSRLVFGFAAEPCTMNRVSFHICWRMRKELQREQQGWEQFFRGWRSCL